MEHGAVDLGAAIITHKIGDAGIKYELAEDSWQKTLMHGALGGVVSGAKGGSFALGAGISAAANLLTAGLSPDTAFDKGAIGLTSSALALGLGGSAKDMNLASSNAERAIEYNRDMHEGEREVLEVLEERLTPEEFEKQQALGFTDVKGYRTIRKDDPKYEDSQNLRKVAGSLSSAEQAEIRSIRSSVSKELGHGDNLFEYSTWNRWSDSMGKRDEGLTQIGASVRIVGGAGIIIGSAVAEFVTAGAATLPAAAAAYGGMETMNDGIGTLYHGYQPTEGQRIFDSFSRPVDSYASIATIGALNTVADVSGAVGKGIKGAQATYKMYKTGKAAYDFSTNMQPQAAGTSNAGNVGGPLMNTQAKGSMGSVSRPDLSKPTTQTAPQKPSAVPKSESRAHSTKKVGDSNTHTGRKTSETDISQNEDGRKLDTKLQPWNVREGQEWKGKVMGKGQKTKTDGHNIRSTREAVEAAKRDDVAEVWMNRGLNKITGSKPGTYKSNYRPDVMIKKKDGTLHPREVPSNSDKDYLLRDRMEEALSRLPKEQQGEGRIINITKSK